MTLVLRQKHEKLKEILAEIGKTAIAFSGGVDSTLLLKVAHNVLGDAAIAITIDSPMFPSADLDEARSLAVLIGVRHLVLDIDELSDPDFASNPPERCYHCKKSCFGALIDACAGMGAICILDGTNADDAGDWRPGMRAARELGVRSPLNEAGFTKAEIRTIALDLGLPNWNKPSTACLASRIPYGEKITGDKLLQVARAEEFLRSIGFEQVRVRHHGDVARIELPSEDMNNALLISDRIAEVLKETGFHFVALDLSGFKSGSMNVVLDI